MAFGSDGVALFNRLLTEIIRRYMDVRIAHNYMSQATECWRFSAGADLDIAAWDSYPLGFLSDRAPSTDENRQRFVRQGEPDFQVLHHDLYRAVGRGCWWIRERQLGPVKWAPWNPDPQRGVP